MGYTLHVWHTPVNFTAGNGGRKYIVIHYTGNRTDTARGNANYFQQYRGASANYFVDEKDVYEVVSPDNSSWAVGVNYGRGNLFGVCTNWNSINIEMCSTNGAVPQATIDNTVELTKSLMMRYGIPASNVVRHWDVCSKRCPGWAGWLPGDEHIWNALKAALTTTAPKPAPKPAPQGVKVAVAYGVFRLYNPNNGDHIFTADAKEVYRVTKAGWKYEGCAMKWPEKGDVDVYRLYNPNAGDHLFTTSEAERKNLVTAGWKYEGKAFRAYSKAADAKAKAVYRLYNKNSGRHILTISDSEHNTLSGLGWHCEGIVFYMMENGDRDGKR